MWRGVFGFARRVDGNLPWELASAVVGLRHAAPQDFPGTTSAVNPIAMTDSSLVKTLFPHLASIALSLLPLGCGGSAPAVHTPTVSDGAPEEETVTMSASSEIGGMNEEKSDEAFQAASNSLERCYQEGQKRIELLSGEITFLVQVDSSGHGEAFVERSTLGDLATERCMTRALAAQRWPAPVGGRIGEARRPFAFEPPTDVRPAVDWTSEDVEDALGKLRGEIAGCKGSGNDDFEATIYVDQDGTVMSAGIAAPASSDPGVADCVSKALKSATFPSPGSWPAKATFAL